MTVCVPEVACVPDHPPEALQDVTLVEDHESTEDWPDVGEVGVAESVTVGAGIAPVTVIVTD